MVKAIRALKIVVAALTALTVGLGGFLAYNYSDLLRNPAKAFNNRDSGFEFTDKDGNLHSYNEGVISFMVYGLDSDTARQKRREGYRTDVMMACVVDTTNNKASLVSIPRDTRAQVQVLNDSGKVTKTVTTKINGAFSYGGGPDKYGYENSLAAVNKVFDNDEIKIEPFEYYVGMDLDGFAAIADAVGGVTVTIPGSENVPNVGKAGQTVTVKGDTARQFIQYRSAGGDLTRTERQREYIREAAKKIKSENPVKTVPKLYQEFTKNGWLKTNMNSNQITALAYALTKIDLDNMGFEMLEGTAQTISGVSYFVADEGLKVEMIKRLFYFQGEAKSKRKPTTAKTQATTAKFTTKKTTAATKAKTTTTKATTKATAATQAPTTTTTTQKQPDPETPPTPPTPPEGDGNNSGPTVIGG